MKKVRMKGILVIVDGMGDLPNKQLGDKTPLEVAHVPNMNFLATRGEMGYMYPIKPGYSPGSDEAIVSIFRNDLKNSSRGQLEAKGAGLDLKKGDLALRCNFGTIDSLEEGNVVDRRVGRTLTNPEAKELAKAINNIRFSINFELVSTVQHRASLVFRGDYSDKISGNDITYQKGSSTEITKVAVCVAKDKSKKAKDTAEILNEFMVLAYDVLKNHPVNLTRKKKGLLPANFLFIRTPGVEKPKLKQYKHWIATNTMPLEKGFALFSGMKSFGFEYPSLKGIDSYKNLWKGLKKKIKHSIKIIKKNLTKAEYVYVHLKETDLPGHDNKPLVKKEMIEYIDKTFIKFLKYFAMTHEIKVVITADHSTPCRLKTHSADPVPVLFYNGSLPREKKIFNEIEAKKGKLGKILGKDLLKKVGFVK